MQPNAEPPPPRHRSDQPAVVFTSDPPDPHHFPAIPGDRGIGFRSNREVRAEMSPVIYRPAGSGDHEPERPARVSIAGPGVPTAASFADETPEPVEPEAPGDDLDEDPEIDDDELAGEADDDLVGDEANGETSSSSPVLGERELYGDDASDDLAAEVTPTVPATPPASQRRPLLQRRRRRVLGWGSDPTPAPEPEPEQSTTRNPAEPLPVAPPSPKQAETDQAEPDQSEPAVESEELTDESAHDEEKPDRALTRPRRVRTLHIGPPPVGPAEDDLVKDDADDASVTATVPEAEPEPEEESAAEDATAAQAGESVAISGHVVSTRGRGLSGVTVVAVDADDQVVGTAVTGRRGQYVVEGLSAGTSYRLGARDTIDGDFTDSWHGGDDAVSATPLQLGDDGTVPDIDVTLTGRVAIDADVDVRRKKVRVEIEVIDRTTGLPGEGTVTISTDQFSTRLPLTEGRANITLFTSPEDRDATDRTDRRLRIEYPGSQHTGPATRTIRLR